MIHALQKRFIIVSMAAITVLLIILVSGINIANIQYNKRQILQKFEQYLNIWAENWTKYAHSVFSFFSLFHTSKI